MGRGFMGTNVTYKYEFLPNLSSDAIYGFQCLLYVLESFGQTLIV